MATVTKAEIMESFKEIIEEIDVFLKDRGDDNLAGPIGLELSDFLIDGGNAAGESGNFSKAIAYFVHNHIIRMYATGEIEKPADLSVSDVDDIIMEIISARFKKSEAMTIH